MDVADEEQVSSDALTDCTAAPAADATDGAPRWFPPGRAPAVIVASGVVLRLGWATVGARTPRILADPALYYQAALRIADGKGYQGFWGRPTAYYPPGYPWFLGVVQWILEHVGLGSHTVGAVAVVQSLLAGVAIAAVMVIANRVGGPRVALAAGVVFACWPNLVMHASVMLSETLFVTLVSVSVAAALFMVRSGRLALVPAVLAGGAMGAATLVRPQVLLVAAAVVLGWALGGIRGRDLLRRSTVLVVGVVVVVAPWTIRNAVVFGAFVPVSTNDGDNLCVGFHPGASGFFEIPKACDTGEFYIDGPGAELRRQSETRSRALDYIRNHPGDLPLLSWKKLWYTFYRDGDALAASTSFGRDQWLTGRPRHVVDAVTTVSYLLIMVGAVAGAVLTWSRSWRTRREDPTGLVVVLAAVASTVVPLLFFGDPRFKVGGTPFYAVLAGVAFAALVERLRRHRGGVDGVCEDVPVVASGQPSTPRTPDRSG